MCRRCDRDRLRLFQRKPSNSGASKTTGGSTAAAKPKGKIAIVATRPIDSAFGKPAADAATQIKSELGNEVTVQGGLAAADVAKTLQGYASRGYGLIIIHGAEMQQQAQQVAPQFPKVKFVVVNGNARPQPEPRPGHILVEREQSGFIAGVVAGLTDQVQQDRDDEQHQDPADPGLYYGFQQGVKHVNPGASTVDSYMATNVPDTGLAASLTSAQASRRASTWSSRSPPPLTRRLPGRGPEGDQGHRLRDRRDQPGPDSPRLRRWSTTRARW